MTDQPVKDQLSTHPSSWNSKDDIAETQRPFADPRSIRLLDPSTKQLALGTQNVSAKKRRLSLPLISRSDDADDGYRPDSPFSTCSDPMPSQRRRKLEDWGHSLWLTKWTRSSDDEGEEKSGTSDDGQPLRQEKLPLRTSGGRNRMNNRRRFKKLNAHTGRKWSGNKKASRHQQQYQQQPEQTTAVNNSSADRAINIAADISLERAAENSIATIMTTEPTSPTTTQQNETVFDGTPDTAFCFLPQKAQPMKLADKSLSASNIPPQSGANLWKPSPNDVNDRKRSTFLSPTAKAWTPAAGTLKAAAFNKAISFPASLSPSNEQADGPPQEPAAEGETIHTVLASPPHRNSSVIVDASISEAGQYSKEDASITTTATRTTATTTTTTNFSSPCVSERIASIDGRTYHTSTSDLWRPSSRASSVYQDQRTPQGKDWTGVYNSFLGDDAKDDESENSPPKHILLPQSSISTTSRLSDPFPILLTATEDEWKDIEAVYRRLASLEDARVASPDASDDDDDDGGLHLLSDTYDQFAELAESWGESWDKLEVSVCCGHNDMTTLELLQHASRKVRTYLATLVLQRWWSASMARRRGLDARQAWQEPYSEFSPKNEDGRSSSIGQDNRVPDGSESETRATVSIQKWWQLVQHRRKSKRDKSQGSRGYVVPTASSPIPLGPERNASRTSNQPRLPPESDGDEQFSHAGSSEPKNGLRGTTAFQPVARSVELADTACSLVHARQPSEPQPVDATDGGQRNLADDRHRIWASVVTVLNQQADIIIGMESQLSVLQGRMDEFAAAVMIQRWWWSIKGAISQLHNSTSDDEGSDPARIPQPFITLEDSPPIQQGLISLNDDVVQLPESPSHLDGTDGCTVPIVSQDDQAKPVAACTPDTEMQEQTMLPSQLKPRRKKITKEHPNDLLSIESTALNTEGPLYRQHSRDEPNEYKDCPRADQPAVLSPDLVAAAATSLAQTRQPPTPQPVNHTDGMEGGLVDDRHQLWRSIATVLEHQTAIMMEMDTHLSVIQCQVDEFTAAVVIQRWWSTLCAASCHCRCKSDDETGSVTSLQPQSSAALEDSLPIQQMSISTYDVAVQLAESPQHQTCASEVARPTNFQEEHTSPATGALLVEMTERAVLSAQPKAFSPASSMGENDATVMHAVSHDPSGGAVTTAHFFVSEDDRAFAAGKLQQKSTNIGGLEARSVGIMLIKLQGWWRMLVVQRNYKRFQLVARMLPERTRKCMLSTIRGPTIWGSQVRPLRYDRIGTHLGQIHGFPQAIQLQGWWRMLVAKRNYKQFQLIATFLPERTRMCMLAKIRGPTMWGSRVRSLVLRRTPATTDNCRQPAIRMQSWWRMLVAQRNYRHLQVTTWCLPGRTRSFMISKIQGPVMWGSQLRSFLKRN